MSQCTPPTFFLYFYSCPYLLNGLGKLGGGRDEKSKYRTTRAQFFFRVGLCHFFGWFGGVGAGVLVVSLGLGGGVSVEPTGVSTLQ